MKKATEIPSPPKRRVAPWKDPDAKLELFISPDLKLSLGLAPKIKTTTRYLAERSRRHGD